ncbi:MAG: hypothetical protein HQ526_04690 [Actinobacteria bacterium]|nr:hypothetical protein [Actinomycetota bacterium]
MVSDVGMSAEPLPILGPDDHGLAAAGARTIAEETISAWTSFLDIASDVDLEAPTRVKKTSARAIVARVGSWPESRQLPQIIADAQAGRVGRIDQDEIDDRAIEVNAARPKQDLLDAVALSRDSLIDWLAGRTPGVPPFDEFALTPVATPLGSLPLVTYMHAGAFQLAVSARDLQPDSDLVPDSLLIAGLRALVDTTGALAARMDIDSQFAVVTPPVSVFTATGANTWITGNVDTTLGREVAGVEGGIGNVLDVASGRRHPLRGLGSRELTVRDVPAMLRLAPIAHDNPGLPGGPLLRRTASWLSVLNRK